MNGSIQAGGPRLAGTLTGVEFDYSDPAQKLRLPGRLKSRFIADEHILKFDMFRAIA